jgi:DnaK suppressor protein
MTASELDIFRAQLVQLKGEIEASLNVVSAADSSISPDNAIGRLTRMEAIQAQSISEAGKGRQKIRLALVERALKAVEDGNYGLCALCGEKIQTGRLKIRPESRVCMRCAPR